MKKCGIPTNEKVYVYDDEEFTWNYVQHEHDYSCCTNTEEVKYLYLGRSHIVEDEDNDDVVSILHYLDEDLKLPTDNKRLVYYDTAVSSRNLGGKKDGQYYLYKTNYSSTDGYPNVTFTDFYEDIPETGTFCRPENVHGYDSCNEEATKLLCNKIGYTQAAPLIDGVLEEKIDCIPAMDKISKAKGAIIGKLGILLKNNVLKYKKKYTVKAIYNALSEMEGTVSRTTLFETISLVAAGQFGDTIEPIIKREGRKRKAKYTFLKTLNKTGRR